MAGRTNIAPDPGDFVGRARELATLDRLLRDGERAITLVGTAGIGKSRLATRWARAHADDVPGGAWLVELGDAPEVAHACAAIARALGLPPPSGSDPVGAVAAGLGELEAPLVVLDECEHLAALGDAVRRLRASAPEAVLLATSRRRLALPGEVVVELAPLALAAEGADASEAEAVRLVLDRVRRRSAGFAPSARELRAIADIAARLDGIPLALELAASRLYVLGAEALAERLSLEALGRRDGSIAARHASLGDAIEWSWRLLDAEDRRALAAASVFVGGLDAAAAEAVIGPGAVERLEALADASLLAVSDPGRAPRLRPWEPVRLFAGARLEEVGLARAELERAHAHYYAARGEALLARIDGAEGLAARAELVRETANLRAAVERLRGDATEDALAVRLALVLERSLGLAGLLDPQIDLLDATLAERTDAPLRARAHLARARPRRVRGDRAGAREDLARAEALARAEGDRRLLGDVRVAQANASVALASGDDAGALFEDALAIAEELGDRALRAHAINGLAVHAYALGDAELARARFAESLAAFRAVGDASWTVIAACQIGIFDLERDELDAAGDAFEEALGAARETGDWIPLAMAIQGRAWVAHSRGDLDAAARSYEDGLALYRRLAARRFEGILEGYLGVLDRERGELHTACALLGSARARLEETGDARHAAIAAAHLAGAEADRGRGEAARRALAAAEELARADPFAPTQAVVRLAEAHLRLADGDPDAARALVDRAERGELGIAPGRSFDLRLAIRVARHALGAAPAPAPVATQASLLLHAEARWFQPPGGELVHLGSRPLLRRLIQRLVAERAASPGGAVSRDALFEAGWPGEKARPSSARNRTYVALNTLRRLGLRDVLVTREDGYLLDPAVPITTTR